MSVPTELPSEGRVLFFTRSGGPRLYIPKPEKSHFEKDQDEADEEERRNALSEDNLVDLSDDETTDMEADYCYKSDTDAEFRSKSPQKNEPGRKREEANDNALEQTQHYALTDMGKVFPFRGKGPEWGSNTASLDCTLVIARLLDLGGILDRGNQDEGSFQRSLPGFQRAFYLEMAYNDWNNNSAQTNKEIRDGIFDAFSMDYNARLDENRRLEMDDFIPYSIVWDHCTSFAPQLQFRTVGHRRCVHCDTNLTPQITPTKRQRFRTDILFSATAGNSKERTTMQEMLQREFAPKPPKEPHVCERGPNAIPEAIEDRLMVLGELPQTLVVVPAAHYRNIEGATSDTIQFNYLSETGERHATYAWLGGTYQSHGNYRVYWDDADNYHPSGHIKVYDPLQADGIIVGGIPPDHPDNKIADYWAKQSAMLFYRQLSVQPADLTPSPSRMGENQKRKRIEISQETPNGTLSKPSYRANVRQLI